MMMMTMMMMRRRTTMKTMKRRRPSSHWGGDWAMLAELDGTCRTPIGGHAVLVADDLVKLTAVLLAEDGSQVFRYEGEAAAADARAMGKEAGAKLKAEAGEDFVANMA